MEPLSCCPEPSLVAEPFPFWFFRAAHEVQPSHEWERHHLRPAHPAVSPTGSGAGGGRAFLPVSAVRVSSCCELTCLRPRFASPPRPLRRWQLGRRGAGWCTSDRAAGLLQGLPLGAGVLSFRI